jgi:hypothetical protein
MATAAREAACLLVIGWSPWPRVMHTFPEDVREALEAFRPEPDEPPKPDELGQWFIRLLWRLSPITTVNSPEYDKYLNPISRGAFTDASLEAAVRKFKFESFPEPRQLQKFLVEWWKEHRPQRRRRRRSLILTDQARRLLLTARAGTAIPNSPLKKLTKLHVRIAYALACRPSGQLSHEQLAHAADASVRTVRRALPALRALRLLPQRRRDPPQTKKMPKHVHGFERVMALIAEHAGVPVKTLYRWEQDLRAGLGKPRQEEWARPPHER